MKAGQALFQAAPPSLIREIFPIWFSVQLSLYII